LLHTIISRIPLLNKNMNLLVIVSDVDGGPLGRMVEFLGHHDAVALAGTCKSLRTALLGDGNHSVCLGWKAIVLETLLQEKRLHESNNNIGETKKTGSFEAVYLHGENDTIGWYGLSQLIHTNLRKRKVLACLGLAKHYHHKSKSSSWNTSVDVNRNENHCLLVGNHATQNFENWSRLPFREHVPRSIRLQCQQTPRAVKYKSVNRKVIQTSEPVRWTNSELRLLAEAGKRGMGRVGELVRKAVNAIAREVPSLPPVASSGSLKGLDPKLLVRGMDSSHPLSLPLSHEMLNMVIQTECCKQSSFGQGGSRRVDESIRKCWTIDLHSDVQVTDSAFQQYLQPSHLTTTVTGDKRRGDDDPGLWTAIHEKFLPVLHGLRDNPQCAKSAYSVVARPNKMLIYEKGGNFKPHRDGQHGPGHFGTLVILLPVSTDSSTSEDIGGDLVLHCTRQDAKVGQCETESGFTVENHKPPTNGASATWHIFMLGTSHEVRPVQCAYRVALTYQLCWFEGGTPVPRAPRPDLLSLLGHSIQQWVKCNNMEELVEFVLPLRHCYPVARDPAKADVDDEWLTPLTESKLRGLDSWLFRGLSAALNGTEMELSLEYNNIDIDVAGYSQGVVVGRGINLETETMLQEEQSKIVWLYREEGDKLADSWPGRRAPGKNTRVVACISLHHKRFRSRYGRCFGISGHEGEWVHPDDRVLVD
jgi:hypothetical protein